MIKINGTFSFYRDKMQWVLMRKTHNKGDTITSKIHGTSKVCEEDVFIQDGFFYSLDQLAKKVVNNLNVSEIESLNQLVDSYVSLTDQITQMLQNKVD